MLDDLGNYRSSVAFGYGVSTQLSQRCRAHRRALTIACAAFTAATAASSNTMAPSRWLGM
eukprot:4054516-Amphidinium_carterae.1